MTVQPRQNDAFPQLPFGHAGQSEFSDPDRLAEALSPNGRATIAYRPLGRDRAFVSRSFSLVTSSARIVASAMTAADIDADSASSKGVLLLPVFGRTTSRADGRIVDWGQGNAAFLPAGKCLAVSSVRSVVSVDIDAVQMQALADSIVGLESGGQRLLIDCAQPRALPTRVGAASLARMLLGQLAAVDALGCDPVLVARAGLDDAILRTALYILQPDLLLADARPPERDRPGIRRACDYIDAHLGERITLTDLERVSGLSARGLQYGFRAAFNLTPLQWIAQRRLEEVRRAILSSLGDRTLTEIATPYFTNLGDFARLYRERFGETPSQTLRSVRFGRTGD